MTRENQWVLEHIEETKHLKDFTENTRSLTEKNKKCRTINLLLQLISLNVNN